MNILVTGANGQLGREMRIIAPNTPHTYTFTDVVDIDGLETEHLDITDADAVRRMVADRAIDCIVNCAAYTNVDRAETDVDIAELLNATAPGNLARAMAEVGGLLVHVSTDYVFGGADGNTPRAEDQAPNPTGVYGVTKLHGEQQVQAAGCRYIILRTAWLYSEFGKNFVKTMLALLASKPTLKVVFDQVGTPTYALDLAAAIISILGSDDIPTGIYHYSNEGVCSWYDFTQMIKAYGMDGMGADVLPCHSSEFPSPVVRPPFSVLDKTKIKEMFGIEIPYWVTSLRTCLANMAN